MSMTAAKMVPRWKRVMARLDERGATYAEIADRPGWFVVEWIEPDYPTPDGGAWQQVYHPGMPGRKQMMRAIARRAAGKEVSI